MRCFLLIKNNPVQLKLSYTLFLFFSFLFSNRPVAEKKNTDAPVFNPYNKETISHFEAKEPSVHEPILIISVLLNFNSLTSFSPNPVKIVIATVFICLSKMLIVPH